MLFQRKYNSVSVSLYILKYKFYLKCGLSGCREVGIQLSEQYVSLQEVFFSLGKITVLLEKIAFSSEKVGNYLN